MRWRKEGRRAALVGMLVVLLVGPMAASGANDVNGSGKYWPFHKTPVTVKFGDNLSHDWDGYLNYAAKKWKRSKVVRPKIQRGKTNPAQCAKKNNTVQVCNDTYGTGEGWLGLTTLYFHGDKIYAATIKINDSFFRQGSYNDPVAKRHTTCHEMGHAIGLSHVNTRSCMNDSAKAVFNNDKPINKDFKTLKRIYSKKNRNRSKAATAGGPAGVLEIPQAAPSELTRVVWLPDATKQVTYLTWGK